MFDQLSDRLQGVFTKISGKGSLTDDNMSDAIREIRRALLEADVNLQVLKRFIDRIRDKADGQAVTKSVDPGQQLIKIVNDELVTLLGNESHQLQLDENPSLIMLFGLQGAGKTTSAAKLALNLRKQNKKPLLIAADIYRPAAINQLQTLGKQIKVPVFALEGETDVSSIVAKGLEQAKADGHDVVLIDTAGRLQVDTTLMAELLLLERQFKPKNKLLVVDGMTGQEALTVAEAFDSQLSMTGLILTKMDGDARGGAALSVVEVTGKPIVYMGVSEKIDGLEPFHPDRMASRILGMGDVVSLVEKAQQVVDLEDAAKLEEKMRKQQFGFDDFLKIQKQLKMLGGLEGILTMLPIPGIDKGMKEMLGNTGETQFKRMETMISSMTVAERQDPTILKEGKRIPRIAKGCGITEEDVRQYIAQFEQMRMMMKQMTGFTDGMKKEQAKTANPSGLHMPRNIKRQKKGKKGGPQLPGMPNIPGMPPMGKGAKGKLPDLSMLKNFPGFPKS
jgi:signal recognition particle subunit SRP54